MPDPSQLSSAFISGETLEAADLDVNNDLMPYFKLQENGEYRMCVISPAELFLAMSA